MPSTDLPNLVVIPKGYAPLNTYGMQLANLAAWHLQRIGYSGILAAQPESGSAQPIGTPSNPAATARRVWLDEPPGSISFNEQGYLALDHNSFVQNGLASGTDITVTGFVVPQGLDGAIKWITNISTGLAPPFTPGALIWKILINGRPVRNYANIQQINGSEGMGREISPIRIFSGDSVAFTVQVPGIVGSPFTAGSTVTGLTGYYYPSKGIS